MLALFRENLHKLHIKLAKRKDDHHFSIHESRSNLEETSLFNIVKPYLTFHHGINKQNAWNQQPIMESLLLNLFIYLYQKGKREN